MEIQTDQSTDVGAHRHKARVTQRKLAAEAIHQIQTASEHDVDRNVKQDLLQVRIQPCGGERTHHQLDRQRIEMTDAGVIG